MCSKNIFFTLGFWVGLPQNLGFDFSVYQNKAECCAKRRIDNPWPPLSASSSLCRSLREVREESSGLAARDAEAMERRKALEKRLEAAEAEASSARADLKVALQRIEDLQQAIQGDLELDDSSASDNSDK